MLVSPLDEYHIDKRFMYVPRSKARLVILGRLPVMLSTMQVYGDTFPDLDKEEDEYDEDGLPPKLVGGKDFQSDEERARTQMIDARTLIQIRKLKNVTRRSHTTNVV